MKLCIGNKNYSSWSMRPWVLMREFGIDFEEVMVRFDGFDADSHFKQVIGAVNPAGKVPVLVDGDVVVWDTLAIAEYLAERFPDAALWPHDRKARARARSVCAEMHSGFSALRGACPMNIEASLPQVGALVMRIKTYALPVPVDVRAYMDRVLSLPSVKTWVTDALAEQDFRDFEEPYRLSRLG